MATLRGEAVTLFGGGEIKGFSTSGISSEEDVRRRSAVHGAHRVTPHYQVDGGVARAIDHETFALFSLYGAFERTQAFYRQLGVSADDTPAFPAYYAASVTAVLFPVLAADNAAYLPALDGFMMLPDSLAGNEVPLALNLGVVGHE